VPLNSNQSILLSCCCVSWTGRCSWRRREPGDRVRLASAECRHHSARSCSSSVCSSYTVDTVLYISSASFSCVYSLRSVNCV